MKKQNRKTLIVNLKNYPEMLGERTLMLALAAGKVSEKTGVEIIIAPPTTFVAFIAANTRVPVFGQGITEGEVGQSTGSVIPESVKGAGAAGTLLNHSEARIEDAKKLKGLVERCQKLALKVCVCVENPQEAKSVAELRPDYIAVEPKELIGTGISVSKAKPGLISETVEVLRKAGFRGEILCGAGITSGEDAIAALKLGAQGILVASCVVKANDFEAKLLELASAMSD